MSILQNWFNVTILSYSWSNLPGLLITVITGILLLNMLIVRQGWLEQVKVGV